MALSLIALGSNLGDRAAHLRAAVRELAGMSGTRLVARSLWHETPPLGGPAGQGAFLNGAALVSTRLEPPELLAELHRVEQQLGRVRHERWGARSLDLDMLLYELAVVRTDSLTLPHPQLATRRFVLTPAVEIAPWMVDADSGWTVAALRAELDVAVGAVAVAGAGEHADPLLAALSARLGLPITPPTDLLPDRISLIRWSPEMTTARKPLRTLILACIQGPGAEQRSVDAHQMRRMLHLPKQGPVAWIGGDGGEDSIDEALAALASAAPPLGAGLG